MRGSDAASTTTGPAARAVSELAPNVRSSLVPGPRAPTSKASGGGLRRHEQPSGPEYSAGDLLSVSTWGRRFALPIGAVAEVLPLVAIEPILGCAASVVGLIRLGGQSIAVHDLGILLGIEAIGIYTLDTVMVVIEAGNGGRIAVVVDAEVGFITAHEVKIEEPLPAQFTAAPIRGVAVIGTRQLSVLDPDGLVAATRRSTRLDRSG